MQPAKHRPKGENTLSHIVRRSILYSWSIAALGISIRSHDGHRHAGLPAPGDRIVSRERRKGRRLVDSSDRPSRNRNTFKAVLRPPARRQRSDADGRHESGANIEEVDGSVTESRRGVQERESGSIGRTADELVTSAQRHRSGYFARGAYCQIPRIASPRHVRRTRQAIVDAHIQGRTFGIFGEPHVNVLELNRARDAKR